MPISHIRLVREAFDANPGPSAPAEPKDVDLLGPTPGQASYESAILFADLDDQHNAFRVACMARSLVAWALDLRRSAARHAPHLFMGGVTPGEKSTEAAEVVMRTHVSEALAGKTRPLDLRKAALRAADEVSAARRVASVAGMNVDDACEGLFRDTESNLTMRSPTTALTVVGRAPLVPVIEDRTLAALLGGVLLGVLVGWLAHWLRPDSR